MLSEILKIPGVQTLDSTSQKTITGGHSCAAKYYYSEHNASTGEETFGEWRYKYDTTAEDAEGLSAGGGSWCCTYCLTTAWYNPPMT